MSVPQCGITAANCFSLRGLIALNRFTLARFFLAAQLDAADLAADRLGQLVDEFYLARIFVGRRHALAMLLQLEHQPLAGLGAEPQLDEGLDDRAAIRVG